MIHHTLNAVPPKSAALPKVRENKDVLKALAKLAKSSGVSESEAVRQLLNGYLRNPGAFREAVGESMDGYLPPCRATEDLVASLRRHAQVVGVSMGEVIRQAVRRGLGLMTSSL